ncbi:hypothetical protein L914_00843, partial [Phytophthora nicotianae]
MLTEKQHVDQVKFALGFVHRGPRNTLLFDSMMDYVDLDEKWLYLLKEKQRFYLGEHEAVPHITVKNKNFIIKVMFLVAVARPRCDAKRHRVWDGKPVLQASMDVNGSNKYKIPHLFKSHIEKRNGLLIRSLSC